jgi:cytochrome bd ubiquinol oxidase subunit II
MIALQVTWWLLVGLLLSIYMIMDGFDLGVGFWSLFARKESDRGALIRSIMPYWDGNEVWLLTGGGAVFAAFPRVYASVFSGFYLALMLVLVGLIFRAVAIEFRGHSDSPRWRRAWDWAFSIGSTIPALLLGVAAGNILRGLPLDAAGNYTGTFFDLLNPYSLLIGVTGLAMFAVHGALFAAMKNEGELSSQAASWAKMAGFVYFALLAISLCATVITQDALMRNYYTTMPLFVLPVVAIAAGAFVRIFSGVGMIWRAFVASSLGMLAVMATLGAAIFPNMVPASNNPAYSLTLANASSSPLTLKTMLILAVIGVPIVLVYTTWIHLTFRGKVGEEAY